MEFKRLSDVALVEEATDTANVLIEEGGEIKRVPKTEVGGNGGGFDAVIRAFANYNVCELIIGDYETIFQKVNAGEFVMASFWYSYDDPSESYPEYGMAQWLQISINKNTWNHDGFSPEAIVFYNSETAYAVFLNPDNTMGVTCFD